jgi:hypothetical protein
MPATQTSAAYRVGRGCGWATWVSWPKCNSPDRGQPTSAQFHPMSMRARFRCIQLSAQPGRGRLGPATFGQLGAASGLLLGVSGPLLRE